MAAPHHSGLEIYGIIVLPKNEKNKGGLSSVADDVARAATCVANIVSECARLNSEKYLQMGFDIVG